MSILCKARDNLGFLKIPNNRNVMDIYWFGQRGSKSLTSFAPATQT